MFIFLPFYTYSGLFLTALTSRIQNCIYLVKGSFQIYTLSVQPSLVAGISVYTSAEFYFSASHSNPRLLDYLIYFILRFSACH